MTVGGRSPVEMLPARERRGDLLPRGREALAAERVALVWAAISGLAVIAYLALYLSTETWQMLGPLGMGLLAATTCLAARALARREQVDLALIVLLATASGVLPLTSLFLSGIVALYAVVTVVASVAVVVLVTPRRWLSWGLVTGALGATLLTALDQLTPWQRMPASQIDVVPVLAAVFAAGGISFVLWLLVRALRTTTIRLRLVVSYLLMGLVPLLFVAGTSSLFAWQNGRQRVLEQVNASLLSDEARIDAWLSQLDRTLADAAASEDLDAVRTLLAAAAPPGQSADGGTARALTVALGAVVEQSGLLDAALLVDREGLVVGTSQGESAGGEYRARAYLEQCTGTPCVRVLSPDEDGYPGVESAVWVLTASDDVLGYLVGRGPFVALGDPGAGQAGAAYLVDPHTSRALSPLGGAPHGVLVETEASRQASQERQAGSGVYEDHAGVPVVGAYRWLDVLQVALVAERPRSEAFEPVTTLLFANASAALIVSVLSVAVALAIARGIATPLAGLADAAEDIAEGVSRPVAGTEREDEIGVLARSLEGMATRLRETITGLEGRVTQRTADLQQRSRYAEAAAEVGRVVSAVLDEERLCRTSVEVIRAQLSLSYVALFLLDSGRTRAEIRAESGDRRGDAPDSGGGDRWLDDLAARVIGAIQSSGPFSRTAASDGDTADQSGRPEIVFPLRSRGRPLGALVVRHDEPVAYQGGLQVALQTMADQVAGSIDNARLFGESQALLAAARRASGELSIESWAEILNARTEMGFRSTEAGVERAGKSGRSRLPGTAPQRLSVVPAPEDGSEGAALSVPIRMYGETIGTVGLSKTAGAGTWEPDQVALVEQIVDELSQALENARLYEETQRRGLREQQLRQIGTRMQSTVDLDAILQGAVADLARAFGVSSAFVQLYEGRAESDGETAEGVSDVSTVEERHGGGGER